MRKPTFTITVCTRERKATGDDEIPVDLVKELGEEGLKTLTKMINDTLEW